MSEEIISLEQGLAELDPFCNEELVNIVTDGNDQDVIDRTKEISTLVHSMCTQKKPFNWSEQLYIFYNECIQKYIENHMLNETLTEEMQTKYDRYIKELFNVFWYLGRYYVKQNQKIPLKDYIVNHLNNN